jgi:hypothetical protein
MALELIAYFGMESLIGEVGGHRLRMVISLTLIERIFRSYTIKKGGPASMTHLKVCWGCDLHLKP